MKHMSLVAYGLLCAIVAAVALASPENPSKTYITHVTLVDTETGAEASNRTIVIAGERIADVLPDGGSRIPDTAHIVDASGKFLIPGLWDMHVHGTDDDSTLALYIANGVTGVREMFGPADANAFRAQLKQKNVLAPHIYLASPIVDGHPKVWPDSVEVTTPDEARRFVDQQKRNGADFIKVYSRLGRNEYFAILDEARKQNISVQGHVPNAVSAWEAAAAGQKSFEHLTGVQLACSTRQDELLQAFLNSKSARERNALSLAAYQSFSQEKCGQLFALMKRDRVWAVPTLVVDRAFAHLSDPEYRMDTRLRYFHGEFLDWLAAKDDFRVADFTAQDYQVEAELLGEKSKIVRGMSQTGVPLLAGTDAGNPFCFPGFSLHDELVLLVESGLTPLAALQAATRNAATFMNASNRYGSIAKGKIADLVLLDADPLRDIRNTTKISGVFLGGRQFDRQSLDLILKTAEQGGKITKLSHVDIAAH
jgi:imidazolonepropionase-like amidohydrolase